MATPLHGFVVLDPLFLTFNEDVEFWIEHTVSTYLFCKHRVTTVFDLEQSVHYSTVVAVSFNYKLEHGSKAFTIPAFAVPSVAESATSSSVTASVGRRPELNRINWDGVQWKFPTEKRAGRHGDEPRKRARHDTDDDDDGDNTLGNENEEGTSVDSGDENSE